MPTVWAEVKLQSSNAQLYPDPSCVVLPVFLLKGNHEDRVR